MSLDFAWASCFKQDCLDLFIADSSDIMLSRVGPGGLLNVNLLNICFFVSANIRSVLSAIAAVLFSGECMNLVLSLDSKSVNVCFDFVALMRSLIFLNPP